MIRDTFTVLNVDYYTESAIEDLKEKFTEDDLYLKIEYHRFISGETLKNFRKIFL